MIVEANHQQNTSICTSFLSYPPVVAVFPPVRIIPLDGLICCSLQTSDTYTYTKSNKRARDMNVWQRTGSNFPCPCGFNTTRLEDGWPVVGDRLNLQRQLHWLRSSQKAFFNLMLFNEGANHTLLCTKEKKHACLPLICATLD